MVSMNVAVDMLSYIKIATLIKTVTTSVTKYHKRDVFNGRSRWLSACYEEAKGKRGNATFFYYRTQSG